ncbi:UDP-N-acetylmuramoylalanyl-D-glutamyl-2,6-diaminopimelate--D-alanyl-D-alanine ligase [Desulfocucumis palustris]|uniref:UDP-N-acetylmuramoyl-tripeptide--D-alanyl-D-alanine ligase n=1 Tax=Desulfocucumis palustris TaxID=1898651 RepID=A0A2L2XDM0_9FIRM|nr:UDP-N-acetylmuramoyl-tripeptide--D-alanyl-D-alanine ligase [Desulfocucumis palustris]GBF34459.1 UDP-N-acetylmuramoylalanyl-D-glutamyl-2,6-diaminopimelate--D-alanyl-D-alanine ligase [Desulfocucumis palustris]
MLPLSLDNIAGVIGAEVRGGNGTGLVAAVSTDSRKLNKGELFFALSGENFDGHNFVQAAFLAGAAGAVVEREVPGLPGGVPCLLVRDSLAALQDLARHNREKSGVPVIGVTGSSGKTSTRDLIHSVLSTKYKTLKTEGNFNNEIGLPLTLLQISGEHRAAVVEMAMRGPGEIDRLCHIALPGAGVITNIGEAHLERLGSVENIARAKGELLDHIPPAGFAVLHGDSPHIREQAKRCRGSVLFFGEGKDMDFYPREVRPEGSGNRFLAATPRGDMEFFVPLPGRHNVINALAAVAVGQKMELNGEQIARGLESAALTAMRLEILDAGGVKIINDTYNANPFSMKAALQVLAEIPVKGRRIAVLADMLELGDRAQEAHREIGEAAAAMGVDYLLTVGELSGHINRGGLAAGLQKDRTLHFNYSGDALICLKGILRPGDAVLVKGSRSMRMEEIVRGLRAD